MRSTKEEREQKITQNEIKMCVKKKTIKKRVWKSGFLLFKQQKKEEITTDNLNGIFKCRIPTIHF